MPNGSSSVWDDETVKELTNRWNNGHSAALIAAALGPEFTRNMIVGKVRRLGLPERETLVCMEPKHATKPKVRRVVRKMPRHPAHWSKPAPQAAPRFETVVELTKTELREMLAQAVRNTAAMQEAA